MTKVSHCLGSAIYEFDSFVFRGVVVMKFHFNPIAILRKLGSDLTPSRHGEYGLA